MLMQFAAFDAAYVERLRSGDSQTQKHFVVYFSELIRLKSGKRMHCASAVEDVRQETFARVLVALHKTNGLRRPERLGAFVNAVCNNVLREFCRGASRQTAVEDTEMMELADSSDGILDHVVRREEEISVRHVIDELSDRDRRVLRAVFLEERDKDEVCRDFGVDRNYLRVLLCRAKRSFKALYLKRSKQSRCRTSRAYPVSSSGKSTSFTRDANGTKLRMAFSR
jgi:RNA polymerase sigma-70 factor, ECF subfamily